VKSLPEKAYRKLFKQVLSETPVYDGLGHHLGAVCAIGVQNLLQKLSTEQKSSSKLSMVPACNAIG
jgi:hypothetical protein